MSPRQARSINVLRESVIAAAVLLFTVPPLLAFCVFAFANLAALAANAAEPAISAFGWFKIWALLTAGVLTLGIAATTSRLLAGRDQPHYDEYRDFTIMRHARHGPLIGPKRTQTGGAEVLSFGLQYMLATRPVPAWWPVLTPNDSDDLVVYRHTMFLTVLPFEPPPLSLWSKAHRWKVRQAASVIRGERCDLPAKLAEHFDLFGAPHATAVFRDQSLEDLMLSNPDWSFEIRGDRLLAYRLPPTDQGANAVSNDAVDEREGIQFAAELADRIGRASERADSGIRSRGLASRLGVDRAVSWWSRRDRPWSPRTA